MELIHSVSDLRARLKAEPDIGFVPTMGNLHAGHIDLTRLARGRVGQSGVVVVSIFVNRLQFGPSEDFDQYPRTLKEDCEKCRQAGVDVVYAPDEHELYPEPQLYIIEPPEIQHILEGAVRPGHFRGVATVVMKLFNVVQPSVAVFGKKDYQQCRVLDNMVRQLNLPIQMILADTVRAKDGLALSSRNGFLSASERLEAPQLQRTLSAIKSQLQAGPQNAGAIAKLEAQAIADLQSRGWQPDYITVRRRLDLLPPTFSGGVADKSLVILAAARLGMPRLLDNLEVSL